MVALKPSHNLRVKVGKFRDVLGELLELFHSVKAPSVVGAEVSCTACTSANNGAEAFSPRAAGGLASQTGLDGGAEVVVLNVAVDRKVVVIVVGRVVVGAVALVVVVIVSFAVGCGFHDPCACSREWKGLIGRVDDASVGVRVVFGGWERGIRVGKSDLDGIVVNVSEVCSKLCCGGLLNLVVVSGATKIPSVSSMPLISSSQSVIILGFPEGCNLKVRVMPQCLAVLLSRSMGLVPQKVRSG